MLTMQLGSHLRTTGGALRNWLVAQAYDSLAVAAMWLVGLLIVGVRWAALWAVLGGALQFVPNFGMVIALIGAEFGALITGKPEKMLYVLIVYAVIAFADGFFLQPYFMKRTARVPMWATILVPIGLGIVFSLLGLLSFWGVLLAPPILAVIYAFRAKSKTIPAASADRPPGT
jgi:predicted PurR-regulated permease PerM